MRGHGGSNAVAGDTHGGGNKAMRGKEGMWRGGKNKMKIIRGRSDTHKKKCCGENILIANLLILSQ